MQLGARALKTTMAKRALMAYGSLPQHLPKMTAAWPPAYSISALHFHNDDAKGDEDGAEARPLPQHLPWPPTV
jgi:hypothetical protein